MPKRLSRQFIVALWGLAAACNGLAMGFGGMPESVTFGRPLDLLVVLNTAPGEPLDASCLSAEVEIGERRLPARAVQVVAEPADPTSTARRLRIRSLQVVDEPVVGISVSAGCRDKVTRQFTVLADPVERAPPPPAMVAEIPGSIGITPPSARPVREAPGAASAEKVSAASAPSPQRRPRAPARLSKPANVVAVAAPKSKPSARPALTVSARAAAAKAPTPRLQLDHADKFNILPVVSAPVNVASDEALAVAKAAQAAASVAASAAAQRMALIEHDMQQLQAAASVNQATAAQVRARLSAEESHNQWVPMLAVLLAVLGGVALWLGGRVRALQRERQAGWAAAARVPLTTSDSSVLSSMPSSLDSASTTPRALPQSTSSWVAAVSSEQAAAALNLPDAPRSQGVSPAAEAVAGAHAAIAARSVSVEELIDLEQRAEFFTVLGQDESAIDLLMVHLHSTGGVSPLPYLRLLEIYRRRDDREAHERTRTRFNHRFNASAPDWDRDPEQGRELLEYDRALARLQTAWRTPVDAMAELEALLFRKTGDDLFELPAYRDVLVLYAVARDLNKMSGATATGVDVLLPLHGDPHGARLEPLHLQALSRDGAELRGVDRPTAPVDLDLNESPSLGKSAFSVLTPVAATLRRPH